jgi:two-component system sensor histidine kinase HydH
VKLLLSGPLRDLAEFKRLKEEVARSEKLASISRLAAGVAHEIRNPLSFMKGYTTYFKEVFEAESEDQEIVITMIEEVDRLNRVVSDQVELAKPVQLSGDLVSIDSLVTGTIFEICLPLNETKNT